MIVTTGLNEIAKVMGLAGSVPTHIAIGTGSSTVALSQTSLLTEIDRNPISLRDTSSNEVTYTADFSAVEMSGITLTEFGLFNSISGATMYQREVIGSVLFTGDNELQIQITHQFN